MQFGKRKDQGRPSGSAGPKDDERKWQKMPEGMYRVVKLKPARGPKPGQSLDAYLYGRDMGHKRDMAKARRQEGL